MMTESAGYGSGAKRTLKSLNGVRPLYVLPADPLAEEVLVPGFKATDAVDCMVCFFSSEVLASLAPSLATYISGSKSSFRLIVSPLLKPEDQKAIENGVKSAEEVADEGERGVEAPNVIDTPLGMTSGL